MYLLSATVGLWYGIARLWRKDDPIQLAKHIEHGSPDLNESLLSAIELQQIPADRRHFSPEFLTAIFHGNSASVEDQNFGSIPGSRG
jgi:hypothetical protein